MAQVPTGSTFAVATAFAAAKTTTIVTNATEAVVTSVAHGFSNGDILEVTSGWGRLNKRYARIKASTTDTFTLEGMDTSDTNSFPPGSGVGSVRKVTTWTQITTVMAPSSSGGDPKVVNYKYIDSDVEFSLNDGFSATNYTMNLDADSIGGAGYTALKQLTDAQTDTCLRIVTRSGSPTYLPCRVALNETPKMQDGQINQVAVQFNGNNRVTRYAS